ncbi:hypothetical protein ACE6H2_015289 [Prunus campanulata]
MLDKNELPRDFHRRAKWVNASQFYILLVEPLEIAKYCRSERRFEIFDRWWTEKRINEEKNSKRIKFAGLTQDSCFWAKVEEARECVAKVRSESDARKQALLWKERRKQIVLDREDDLKVDVKSIALRFGDSTKEWITGGIM